MTDELKGVALNCGSCGQNLPILSTGWEVQLPVQPPSQNRLGSNSGRNRFKYKGIRDDFIFLLQAAEGFREIPKATGRRRVYITRLYRRGTKRDRGNLSGGCKPLLDAMTTCGLIVDDREEFLEDHYNQINTCREPTPEHWFDVGVHIRIEEMDEK